MKYRVMTDSGDKQLLDAQQLYAREVKRRWRKVRGMPWRAVAVEVELDVSEGRRGGGGLEAGPIAVRSWCERARGAGGWEEELGIVSVH